MSIHLVLLNWTRDGLLEAPSTCCCSKTIIFHLTKFGYVKLSLLFMSQLNSILGKTHETPQES